MFRQWTAGDSEVNNYRNKQLITAGLGAPYNFFLILSPSTLLSKLFFNNSNTIHEQRADIHNELYIYKNECNYINIVSIYCIYFINNNFVYTL